ncbi:MULTISPECIES: hypothetical protein [unclassified Maridesulfovibrio]|uniref:hypothetical protein n=1 Tax=unclassified Maridesulfovibrio TaxID=2794999 RepID=UPI003B409172
MKSRMPVDPTLTSIAIAWRNPDGSLIADEVMFRCSPIPTMEFKYLEYDIVEGIRVPETAVGRKGKVNEVDFQAEEKDGSTKDYGLDDLIPQTDLDAAKSRKINLQGDSVEYIMGLVELDREIRVASVVQDPNNYNANNVESLSGSDMFTDPASKPLEILTDALESMFIRGNTLTMGQGVWSKIRRHPNVLKSFYPNGGGGSITRKQLCEELEIDRLLVGSSFVNNARKGQAANPVRTWGNSVAFHYQDRTASNKRGMTWGLTVPFGKPVAMQEYDSSIGLRGGVRVRAGESVSEKVLAKDAGYLIENVI